MRSSLADRWIVFFAAGIIVSCNNNTSKNTFEVKGTVSNHGARIVYLEEVPMASMQPVIVDSCLVDKGGRFVVKTNFKEESVYQLSPGVNTYPLAFVINDVPKLSVQIYYDSSSGRLSEKFDVNGSSASMQLKDFMYEVTERLKNIFYNLRSLDSLQKTGAPDNVTTPLATQHTDSAKELKEYVIHFLAGSKNPSLTMFALGYYQATANSSTFGLSPFSNEEVNKAVADLAAKFPTHTGVAAIKKAIESQIQTASGWVGKPAPEIILPDVNGKEVKLSSFKGKYVLVDFWASWCKPCRAENPNVVKAYNKFRNENFTILGVSLDRPGEKDQWLNAIKNDKLSWTHVSDLKYWESEIVPLYHIDAIPFNVLVDPEGKIIAESLRGAALDAKLGEIFK